MLKYTLPSLENKVYTSLPYKMLELQPHPLGCVWMKGLGREERGGFTFHF